MKSSRSFFLAALLAVVALPVGALAADAATNWGTHCASCHGKDGKGQTKMGHKLNVKDFSVGATLGLVTNEQIIKSITAGVTDQGKRRMSPYAEKLTAEEIAALVPFVRKLAPDCPCCPKD